MKRWNKNICLWMGLVSLLSIEAVLAQDFPYMNSDLPIEERVEDIVSRMTLEEKARQMLDIAPAIERLGVPEYNWWNEALHGVARSGLATSYPQAIGFAATWNEELIFDMATAISDEARAKHQEYIRNNSRERYQGLTIWSPNINIFRDPRWGRGQETYGEDPFLTGRLAVNFIKGLQGDDPKYFKTVATVKHFAVHNGPEPLRHTFDAIVSERDLRETYLPMFEDGIIEGGAYSIMCAYNRVNGEAACSSEELLVDILRDEWAFEGFIVSDCWALDDIWKNHKLVPTAAEAAARALKAGTDLDCGTEVYPFLVEAVEKGYITEDEIDVSLRRLFTARMKLGMFDPPEKVSYQTIPYSVVDSEENKALALQVARESMVLLKNDGTLPLSKKLNKIAVIGPNADQELVLLGNYNGIPSDIVTPLEGIVKAVSKQTVVSYALGSELVEGFPVYELLSEKWITNQDGEPGISAFFYADTNATGSPLHTKTYAKLSEEWGNEAPFSNLDPDNFSSVFTGTLKAPVSGGYQFQITSTMQYDLYIGNELILESSTPWGREAVWSYPVRTDKIMLEEGKEYDLKMVTKESFQDARLYLSWALPPEHLNDRALEIASEADAVVLVMGLTPRLEGEEMSVELDGFNGGDRTDIDLPDAQKELIKKITQLGKPTVLVLLNGSALAIPEEHSQVNAVLEAWYGGQAGGTAIADVLFGNYNPSGRLPVTFYKSTDDLPPFEDYAMANRTYRYFEGEALYSFGHGLSYTTFTYGDIRVNNRSTTNEEAVIVEVEVTNTGDRAGDEVVQLYVSYPESEVIRPIRDLRGFDRIFLESGETKTVEFTLNTEELRYWDSEADAWVLEKGPVKLQVGASSADIRQEFTIDIR